MLLDIGIWGQTDKYLQNRILMNRMYEEFSQKIGAKKMLYAHTYYTKYEFWHMYDRAWYDALRSTYHATNTFPDIWEKIHATTAPAVNYWSGLKKFFADVVRGKNINA